jgi:hypothetical protein
MRILSGIASQPGDGRAIFYWELTLLDLSIIVEGEFFVKFHLRNRNDDF